MSDREMLAYAIIILGALIYGGLLLRWWYMSPRQLYARRDKLERERNAEYRASRALNHPSEGES